MGNDARISFVKAVEIMDPRMERGIDFLNGSKPSGKGSFRPQNSGPAVKSHH
jgi:hypothetical protein